VPVINILPKEVYSLIAAGEVVERPMSVVKEMIENSIDAGAKHITLEIKNGGTTYIRITDDGCGIPRQEVKKVFISHATSKIETGADLESISTLGFRGEAMASIAAVSKVELLTKTADEAEGTRYEIAAGEEKDFSAAGCPNGTTIVVRDIFFNVPARMKFLKKDVTEGNSVQGVIERIALSHPEISFRFIREGKQVLVTAGNGDLKGTIYSVFGGDFSNSLLPVEYEYGDMKISGFASKPHEARRNRAMQFSFINGRLVKSVTACAALEQAYKNSIMVGRFPACVLNIEMDARMVDVNVHPAKIEVRFTNEKPVFDLIYYGVKTALETKNTVKEASGFFSQDGRAYKNLEQKTAKIDFGVKQEPPSQMKINFGGAQAAPSKPNVWRASASKPVEHKRKDSYGHPDDYRIKDRTGINVEGAQENEFSIIAPVKFTDEKKQMPENLVLGKKENPAPPVIEEKDEAPDFTVIGEAFNTYIIIEIKNDLFYIDKHAAHERMNFEKLRAEAQQGVASQVLLSPATVKLSAEEYDCILGNLPLLSKCGFAAEDFGNSTVIVREIPSLLAGANVKDLIVEIAGKLLEHKTDIEPDKMDWIFHSASCRAAVKGGDYTSPQEREMFVKKLLSMPDIQYCPHGRPVMLRVSKYEIEKQFGRIQ
jgi:DNA mismatch repair protein MutL